MTIHLPKELEASIEAAVHGGRFASVDDAMGVAARLLLQQMEQGQPLTQHEAIEREETPDLLLGSMRAYADEMDEIVAEVMRQRR